jgi:hypothetical protein
VRHDLQADIGIDLVCAKFPARHARAVRAYLLRLVYDRLTWEAIAYRIGLSEERQARAMGHEGRRLFREALRPGGVLEGLSVAEFFAKPPE